MIQLQEKELAQIVRVFGHKSIDEKEYFFVEVRWFSRTEVDSLTNCNVYLPSSKREKWQVIFSERNVVENPLVTHFCTTACHLSLDTETKLIHSGSKKILLL